MWLGEVDRPPTIVERKGCMSVPRPDAAICEQEPHRVALCTVQKGCLEV